jgi:hypothetical protein
MLPRPWVKELDVTGRGMVDVISFTQGTAVTSRCIVAINRGACRCFVLSVVVAHSCYIPISKYTPDFAIATIASLALEALGSYCAIFPQQTIVIALQYRHTVRTPSRVTTPQTQRATGPFACSVNGISIVIPCLTAVRSTFTVYPTQLKSLDLSQRTIRWHEIRRHAEATVDSGMGPL